jgi:pilus assembly protein CpaB
VLIAARDLNPGETLAESAVKWLRLPEAMVGPGALTKSSDKALLDQLASLRVRELILAGEPINQRKIAKADDRSVISLLLPAGRRAVTVSVSAESGVGGLIQPNDRVDVILVRKIQGRARAETLLTNVRVLALDQALQRDNSKKGPPPKTATLEIETRQAEMFAAAVATGKVSLALRALADNATLAPGLAPEVGANFGKAEHTITILRQGVASIVKVGP